MTDTPGSVSSADHSMLGDGHPSRPYVAAWLKQPTRTLSEQLHCALSGLAPGGVYRATPVTWHAGGLLHHRFTLTHTKWAVYFLWHFPAGHPGWVLPTTLLCGARTFLGDAMRPRGRLAISSAPPEYCVRRCPRIGQLVSSITWGTVFAGERLNSPTNPP